MPDRKMYSKVMAFHEFCMWYLDITPESEYEMQKVFREFRSGKIKIKKGVMIKGDAIGGGFFATSKMEFERISDKNIGLRLISKGSYESMSNAFVIAATLGVEMRPCDNLIVLHFFAFDNEVREPIEDDVRGDENWITGGRTKNLITGTTDEGAEEVVIKQPLPAVERIKGVDYIGHVDYNL